MLGAGVSSSITFNQCLCTSRGDTDPNADAHAHTNPNTDSNANTDARTIGDTNTGVGTTASSSVDNPLDSFNRVCQQLSNAWHHRRDHRG